ncbi:MAG: pilus assembly protein [Steroidobacteraceae bacterium]
MISRTTIQSLIAALALLLGPALATAQTVISENFTDASVPSSPTEGWTPYLGACLTAGDGTGSIPSCTGLTSYYGTNQNWVGGYNGTLPDPVGDGALRLTNGWTTNTTSGLQNGFNQAGGIISNFTQPTNSGVSIVFTAVSYAGNSYDQSGGATGDGADGIGFFILDGTAAAPYVNATTGQSQFDVGAFGGSLGYTCSNTNDDSKLHPDDTPRGYDGVVSGYFGLGLDEYGNFMNGGLGHDNTASGPGFEPDTLGVRGPGSINWYTLNALHPDDYPSSLVGTVNAKGVLNTATGIQDTCETGYLWQWTTNKSGGNGQWTETSPPVTVTDYPELGYKALTGLTLADESARTRPAATPITYKLTISQKGTVSVGYYTNGGTLQPVITNFDLTDGGKYPLPSTLRFGFSGSTGGGTNVHELLCFQAGPSSLGDTSLGVNDKNAEKIAAGEQAFLASYDPTLWTGDLTANNLLYDPTTQLVSVSSTANWDASCTLTGGNCPATGQTNVIAQSPSSRTILTWKGSQGVALEWSDLTTAQQNDLDSYNASDSTEPQLSSDDERLLYLRGDRTNEVNTQGQGLFRYRKSVLGDIIDSDPTWVGPPNAPYSLVWRDYLYPAATAPENGANSYPQFASTEQTRLNVVYVGSNDGMIHGFRAGSFDANNNFLGTDNDGEEVLAYMPAAVLQAIHTTSNDEADYSDPYYSHEFYVDATPDAGDLYYANAWHTWLVGGLGAGGEALYALDVTNPGNFSEAKAANIVIGEWTPSTITCTNVASCGQDLGDTYGTPVIRRLHNGMWGVIFGNGYGSASGDAGIYIMTIDPTTGAGTFYYLSTGQGGTSDGIAYPAPADLDGDNIIDYVYAGDLKGHVWRFDLTSSDPSNWSVTPTPVFTDPSGNPITTKVNVQATVVSTGTPRVLVIFGTGRKVPMTVSSAAKYASGTEHLYGIWDSNMGSWNALSAVKYTSLTSPPTSFSSSNLQQQTLTAQVVKGTPTGVLDDSSNPVCWADSASCSANPQYGWYIALPGTNEQVIFNSLVYQGTLYVNTTVPPVNAVGACTLNTETGDTIAVSAVTGGVVEHLFPGYSDASAAGQQTNGSGTPFVVLAGGSAFVLTQTVTAGSTNGSGTGSGSGITSGLFVNAGGSQNVLDAKVEDQNGSGNRLTWTELR